MGNNIVEIIDRNKKQEVPSTPQRKIESIDEIFDGEKLLITDFSDLDLSGIDLSEIPMSAWVGCIFHNTNFSNTGIIFLPNMLKHDEVGKRKIVNMLYCDFSGNDLSFLESTDFNINGREINTTGCNFRGTNLRHDCLRHLYDVTLDESYGDYDFDYWGDFDGNHANFDLLTVIKNPFLNLSSSRLVRIFEHFTLSSDALLEYEYMPKESRWKWSVDHEKLEQSVKMCEYGLQFDKQGHFRRMYEQVTKDFSLEQKYWFFRIQVQNSLIKDANLEGIPMSVLRHYYFDGGNTFENVKISNPISELLWFNSEQFYDGGNKNKFNSLYLTGVNFGSWKEKPAEKRRISSSAITFFTKVYLELSRVCNAKCKFCRNDSFEKTSYDLQQILETLNSIKQYLNAVVIGGGEPTLRLEDAIFLKEQCDANHIDWHIFTNGTNPSIIDNENITKNFKINLSRHAVNDSENANIFGINQSRIMSQSDVSRLSKNAEVTLNATCFNGGLDTPTKILEYIDFAREIGCSKVLIQNLQKNSSLGTLGQDNISLHIDDAVLTEVIRFLRTESFKQKRYPIYASGGYVTYIFKDPQDDFSISIQKYITKDDLSKNWPKAVKRAFDLSISPDGKLFENWHQNYGEIDTSCFEK